MCPPVQISDKWYFRAKFEQKSIRNVQKDDSDIGTRADCQKVSVVRTLLNLFLSFLFRESVTHVLKLLEMGLLGYSDTTDV